MAASLPPGLAISRTARRAAAARPADGRSLTSPGPEARIDHEVQGGVGIDDACCDMVKKVIEAVSAGRVVGVVPIDLWRIWPFKAPGDHLYIREAAEEFYLRRIPLPADTTFPVRDPCEGDPTDY